MPKKGVNKKSEAALARKTAAESASKAREAKEKEDQYWREAEGTKSRAAKKREEEAEKRAEATAKKAEARRLAELEEKELEKILKKPADKKADTARKVTEADLLRRKEEELAAMQRLMEEEKRKKTRTADQEEYERSVSMANINRDASIIEARTVDDAIAQMTIVDSLPLDKNPEKRLKASFKAFEEIELPRLKEEKPGLTHNQYKTIVWKLWKKSPDNPLSQVKAAGLCCMKTLRHDFDDEVALGLDEYATEHSYIC